MRRLTADKRALAVVALLGLLLAGLGAYAIFRDVLQARIEVATGKFDFNISKVSVKDFAGEQPGPENPDIAKCDVRIEERGNRVRINITNAYPLYGCEINLTFLNRHYPDSTIPGRYEGKRFIELSPGWPDWLFVHFDEPQLNVRIDPGQSVVARIIVRVQIGAPQNERAGFTVEYSFRQFLPNP